MGWPLAEQFVVGKHPSGACKAPHVALVTIVGQAFSARRMASWLSPNLLAMGARGHLCCAFELSGISRGQPPLRTLSCIWRSCQRANHSSSQECQHAAIAAVQLAHNNQDGPGFFQCCLLQMVQVDVQETVHSQAGAQDPAAAASCQPIADSGQPNLVAPPTGDETTDDDDPVPHDATQIQSRPADHVPELEAETQQQQQQNAKNADPRTMHGSQSARVLRDVLGTPDTADNDSEWQPELSGNQKGASGEAHAGDAASCQQHASPA